MRKKYDIFSIENKIQIFLYTQLFFLPLRYNIILNCFTKWNVLRVLLYLSINRCRDEFDNTWHKIRGYSISKIGNTFLNFKVNFLSETKPYMKKFYSIFLILICFMYNHYLSSCIHLLRDILYLYVTNVAYTYTYTIVIMSSNICRMIYRASSNNEQRHLNELGSYERVILCELGDYEWQSPESRTT